MRFADTNILLYAVSTDPSEQEKAKIALAVLESRHLALSVQVLQEFYVQATRRARTGSLNPRSGGEFDQIVCASFSSAGNDGGAGGIGLKNREALRYLVLGCSYYRSGTGLPMRIRPFRRLKRFAGL